MEPELPEEAVELGSAARRAFEDLGGVDLARLAEHDPGARAPLEPVLAQLGVDELEPCRDPLSLAAAAALCREAGRVALPHPLAAALVRDADGRPTACVPAGTPRVDHATAFPSWRVGTLEDRSGGVARPVSAPLGGRLGPFVADLELDPDDPADPAPPGHLLVQQCLVANTVLGGLERAVELARDHVTNRVQFGQPLSAFQAVQFQLADAAVAVAGLRELAGFTLWRLGDDPDGARGDVLALRLHAIDTGRSVLRTAQQLHGAAGVCDEYDVSVLVRALQPALRLPIGEARTVELLAAAIDADGFVGLFPHGRDVAGATTTAVQR